MDIAASAWQKRGKRSQKAQKPNSPQSCMQKNEAILYRTASYIFKDKSRMHESAYLLTLHNLLEIAYHIHIEHIDGKVIFATHCGGSDIHDFETA